MVDSMLLLDRSSHCFCCVALCCVCWNQQWPNLNSPENLAQKKFTAAKLTSMLPPFPQLQWPHSFVADKLPFWSSLHSSYIKKVSCCLLVMSDDILLSPIEKWNHGAL
jgi:hypothetical protein